MNPNPNVGSLNSRTSSGTPRMTCGTSDSPPPASATPKVIKETSSTLSVATNQKSVSGIMLRRINGISFLVSEVKLNLMLVAARTTACLLMVFAQRLSIEMMKRINEDFNGISDQNIIIL